MAAPRPGILPPDGPARLARVRLVALDVDGTLTEGHVIYDDAGREIVAFCAHDGQGLAWLAKHGIHVAWISGRGSQATERRAKELRIPEVHLHVGPKAEVLAEIQERLGIDPSETAAMGDDLPDLDLAARAGFFAAPSNARPEVQERADLVTKAQGGFGAVRELVDCLLRAQNAFPTY